MPPINNDRKVPDATVSSKEFEQAERDAKCAGAMFVSDLKKDGIVKIMTCDEWEKFNSGNRSCVNKLMASGVGKVTARAICDEIHPEGATVDILRPSLFDNIKSLLERAESAVISVVDSIISGFKTIFQFLPKPQPRYYDILKEVQTHEIKPSRSAIIGGLINYVTTPHNLIDAALAKQIRDLVK